MLKLLHPQVDSDPGRPLRAAGTPTVLPWSLLDTEARSIVRGFVTSWRRLLEDTGSTEHDLHKVIAEHPAFFFLEEYQVVSKPEFGSEHQADFVIASDQMSAGIHYRFIELESPHEAAYTARGNPSARLTHAVQQMIDWKRWIKSNRGQYKKLFPSNYLGVHEFDNLSFCIYIGRRDQSPRLTALRNEFASEVRIDIRSFDSLLERLRDLGFRDLVSEYCGDSIEVRNMLANPFLRAYKWGAWKDMVLKGDFICAHFLAKNAAALLRHRSENTDLGRFRAIWKRLPEVKRKFYLKRLLDSR